MKNTNAKRLEELTNAKKQINQDAFDIVIEYLDDALNNDELIEELEKLKNRSLELWSEASKLM